MYIHSRITTPFFMHLKKIHTEKETWISFHRCKKKNWFNFSLHFKGLLDFSASCLHFARPTLTQHDFTP